MHKNTNILLIDDSVVTRFIFREVLMSHCEYIIHEASNGLEAFKKIEQGPPDLIICDYRMDKMDGLQLIEGLRFFKKYREIPIIMVSSEANLASLCKNSKIEFFCDKKTILDHTKGRSKLEEIVLQALSNETKRVARWS